MSSLVLDTYSDNRPEVFCKKGVLRNFAKFRRKHLCQRLFSNKVEGIRPENLLKEILCTRFSYGYSLWKLEDVSPQHKSCDCADQFNTKTSTVHGCTRRPNPNWVFFPNLFSSFSSFSCVFSKYLHSFLPFFFCIIFDDFLFSICISSTIMHMLCCITLYFI